MLNFSWLPFHHSHLKYLFLFYQAVSLNCTNIMGPRDWLTQKEKEKPQKVSKNTTGRESFNIGGVYIRKLALAQVLYWGGFLISYRIYVFFLLSSHDQHDNAILIGMCYPFQFTSRMISHRNEWLFRIYIMPSQNFIPERNSRSGTTTGVNSHQGDSPGMIFGGGIMKQIRSHKRESEWY